MNEEGYTKQLPGEEQQMVEPKLTEKQEKRKAALITSHQIVTITLIHLTIIIFQAFNIFPTNWLPSVLYGLISGGTIVFAILKRKIMVWLIPITFGSLIAVNYAGLNLLAVTILFAVNLVAYAILIFWFKDGNSFIGEVLTSSIAFLSILYSLKADRVFYGLSNALIELLVFMILWTVVNGLLIVRLRERKDSLVVFSFALVYVTFISSFARYLYEAEVYFNAYHLSSIILLALGMLYTCGWQMRRREGLGLKTLNLANYLIAAMVFSYIFPRYFTLMGSATAKTVLVDYLLFIPVVIAGVSNLVLQGRAEESKEAVQEKSRLAYQEDKIRIQRDWKQIGFLAMFLVTSLLMSIDNNTYNHLRSLIVSLLFLGVAVVNQAPATLTTAILTGMAFQAAFLQKISGIQATTNMIILMSLAAAVLLVAILNELVIAGEPFTSAFAISGSVMLMISSVTYFYMTNFYLRFILPGIIWAAVGLLNFAMGLLFNQIFMRRMGLSIILADIVYTIVTVIIAQYKGWQIGVTFIVLAIVLLGCIVLFRWSEQKQRKEEAQKQSKGEK